MSTTPDLTALIAGEGSRPAATGGEAMTDPDRERLEAMRTFIVHLTKDGAVHSHCRPEECTAIRALDAFVREREGKARAEQREEDRRLVVALITADPHGFKIARRDAIRRALPPLEKEKR